MHNARTPCDLRMVGWGQEWVSVPKLYCTALDCTVLYAGHTSRM